jgi:hypothetical protein
MSYDIFFVRRDPGQTFEDALDELEASFENGDPDEREPGDDLDLMTAIYELARAVEDVTGLEGYDPQLGEPVSDLPDDETPRRRHWPDDAPDDDDDVRGAPAAPAPLRAVGDPRADMAPEPRSTPRRWWEFWKS